MSRNSENFHPAFRIFKAGKLLFYTSLVIHVYAAIIAFRADYFNPFSEGKEMGEYLRATTSTEDIIIAGHHFHGPPVSVYLGRPLYYPERNAMATYCIWNTQPFMISDENLSRQLDSLSTMHPAKLWLITNEPGRYKKLKGSFLLEETARFDRSIVRSENFYLYAVHGSQYPAAQ